MLKMIQGGVTAAQGFSAGGVHCGIRKNRTKRDLALIASDRICSAACVYTQNLVKGAPITVTQKNVANGKAQAIICNSGNANTCNANGLEIAMGMCILTEKYTDIAYNNVIVASTGVIGKPLDITPIRAGLPELVASLSADADGSAAAADAIMTTDTAVKEIAYEFELGGKLCHIGGIAKGSGMIHPNMATMLVFITTDAAVSPKKLQALLSEDVKDSFNMLSVDGDTSTNDMVSVLANGAAGNAEPEGAELEKLAAALAAVTHWLCRAIAKDGEGATRLLDCIVDGAADRKTAKTVAKSVVCSSLLKAAMFGADANWGRVLCAIGYSGADVDVKKIDVSFESAGGSIEVCRNGAGVDFSEELAKQILLKDEIKILIGLNSGDCSAEAWGCDLTYDYVKINGDYRT